MKLNLEYGNLPLNGYTNISFGFQGVDQSVVPNLIEGKIVSGDFHNIDPLCDDSDAEEIIFNPLLNQLGPSELVQVLEHWHKKLTNGGILILQFVDIQRVAKGIISGKINLQDAHGLILGKVNQLKSLTDLSIFKVVSEKLGYNIESIIPNDVLIKVILSKKVNDAS